MKKALKDIWIQFLAECIEPFLPDKNFYMKFTRRFMFIKKMDRLQRQEFKRAVTDMHGKKIVSPFPAA